MSGARIGHQPSRSYGRIAGTRGKVDGEPEHFMKGSFPHRRIQRQRIIVCFYSSFFISNFCSIVFSTLLVLYIRLLYACYVRIKTSYLLTYILNTTTMVQHDI